MIACIVIVTLALAAVIAVLVRSIVCDQRDDEFNPNLPYNTCEAIIAYHAGMNVTCGRKTNYMVSGYWVCTRHPVPTDAKPKESPRRPVLLSLR